jgi:cytochrome P450
MMRRFRATLEPAAPDHLWASHILGGQLPTTSPHTKRFSLLDPGYLADPYATYAWLRDESPVHHMGGGYWAVSRHDDCVSVLRDSTTFSSYLGYGGLMQPGETASALGADDGLGEMLDSGMGMMMRGMAGFRVLIATDPPDHTRLRRLVGTPFNPRNVWALESHIRDICNDLIDEMLDARQDGVVDLWSHISYPLPTMVIAEMLGIPTERKADFKRWSDAVVNGLSLSGVGNDPKSGMSGAMEMWQYFSEVIEERRAQPRDDLISTLVNDSSAGDDPLTTGDLILFCILLLLAGNETTTNLLGNFFRAGFAHPEQLELLRENPDLLKQAVEEALRYDSPVQGLWRGTTRPASVNGVEIPADARVMVLFASANRDERHWGPDAGAFRIDRNPANHIAFGTGVHVCLGQALARLEARVAIDLLLRRSTELAPAGDPTPTLSPVLRGVTSQPVRIVSA